MEKILPWFALKSINGIGNHLFKRLIDNFKSPESVFKASDESLSKIRGMSPRLIASIKNYKIPDWVKMDIDLAIQKSYSIVTMADPLYPKLLLQIPDPPPFIYVYGTLQKSIKNIAVVGSRSATNYGISTTKQLCAELVSYDIIIVSGMARGIDTAAHTGALTAKGKTIAVLGSGLEKIYPKENEKLFHQIAEQGAVISEFSLLSNPEQFNFPLRNRIISGISLGTVVVEAAYKSGSLITARIALEQNREVFAVPGNVSSFKSAGTHNLIKQGAKLVVTAKDIIDEIVNIIDDESLTKPDNALNNLPDMSDDEKHIFNSLESEPIHIDELVRKTNFDAGRLLSILLMLELKGIIQKMPGNYFLKYIYFLR